ncbi:peptide ABC transporter ATP-binding protein [Candidatus Formimonas warabiya]|uniref:Peptide ABC transporter ATP-binding protein n=1 Tax=Formimonas warabiya TaxID=1761012 RepID=A0A3G1KTR1_FORW1|nr:peptide ABC transporter ATP-binding protein [Candidatus Formimonas warabiya]
MPDTEVCPLTFKGGIALNNLLEVKELHISFHTHGGKIQAVRGVNFDLSPGEAIAIVGESGCGKSVTAQAIMGLIPDPPGRIERGKIFFQGLDLTSMPEDGMEKVRGREISMIFQDPMTALNPTMTIGKQITEGWALGRKISRRNAEKKAIEMLNLVGLPYPEKRVKQYPHECSGGMRQRVMIAMALAGAPKLLIADEPTTALDVTIQAQIMELMKEIKNQTGTSIILITHDLGVVAGMASRILVMYAGKIVESGSVREVFFQARHPYTWALLKSVPRLDEMKKQRLASIGGQPPDLFKPPGGCAFAPRCPYGMVICREKEPQFVQLAYQRGVACWLEHPQAPSVEKGATAHGK